MTTIIFNPHRSSDSLIKWLTREPTFFLHGQPSNSTDPPSPRSKKWTVPGEAENMFASIGTQKQWSSFIDCYYASALYTTSTVALTTDNRKEIKLPESLWSSLFYFTRNECYYSWQFRHGTYQIHSANIYGPCNKSWLVSLINFDYDYVETRQTLYSLKLVWLLERHLHILQK